MMELLVQRYRDRRKLYFSWDAASWHISKSLYSASRSISGVVSGNGPTVATAPLPAGAQFLNVIESVFSGMAGRLSTTVITRRWTMRSRR